MKAMNIPIGVSDFAEIREIFETTVAKWFSDQASGWNRRTCCCI